MKFLNQRLALFVCGSLCLTSYSIKNVNAASSQSHQLGSSNAKQAPTTRPSFQDQFPEEVNRTKDCDNLTPEECEKLEIDTNAVFEQVPG